MRILILGASGMLGSTMFRDFAASGMDVYATARDAEALRMFFHASVHSRLIDGVGAYDFASVIAAVNRVSPDVVINCIGLIRQLPEGRYPLPCIEINARFPHLLLALCKERNIRLIHYSTDCVFDGQKGSPYTEEDPPTAKDVYGLSKYLGEVKESPALTIRTSIIGHELRNKRSLVEWFLAQTGTVKGYTHAIYSGLPVAEHARIVRDYVLPSENLHGLFHVAGKPISKYELLRLIGLVYKSKTIVEPESDTGENKTLSGEAFYRATGYISPEWPELIESMYARRADYTGENAQ